ncbi:acyl carrier protein [Xanthobacter pseudotagetidis]|uniref:acyl carrier protein n=1 Tax=Xanthobacter pseudotagetidis TaxID=3119911 RepID=UPI00372B8486
MSVAYSEEAGGGPNLLDEGAVRQAIREAVDRPGVDSLGADTDFYRVGLDSLDHAQILMRVEELFGLTVADADFDLCRSISAIVAYGLRSTGGA